MTAMRARGEKRGGLRPAFLLKLFGVGFFVYLFFGFMLLPTLNTLTQIFTAKNPTTGATDPWAVIRFFLAGSMSKYLWNSVKLAVLLVVTVNVVGVSLVLLTEYFDIKGANILRMGYMTTLIYGGIALGTGYLFLYDSNGIITTLLINAFPGMNPNWFSGFRAVLFTMTFAVTSNHMLFLRNAIRGIDYNTVEAARNLGAGPLRVLWKVVFPTLLPTMFSLTVMTFITGLCAMSAPVLLGYDSINPEIVRLAGSSVADEAFPQARAALLSVILALFTIGLLTILSAYEKRGHYLSVSKTKARLVKQKINNPIANALAHIYAYVLFVVYMTPVVMIVIFSFQTHSAIQMKTLDFSNWTLINYVGQQDFSYLTSRGVHRVRQGAISGVFSNEATLGGIRTSFILSALAAAAACVIVVVACNYIFKRNKKGKLRRSGAVLEYSLLFPWLLPTILICYSYRIYFNSNDIWYVANQNLYYMENVRLLIIIAYMVVKLPFSLRMIKASFYAIDSELEDAARSLGAGGLTTFLRVKLPIILPSVLAVFALNFNALFTEYDMSATFASSYGTSYAMVLQSMTREEGLYGYNVNATGRRNASTVFIMLVSGLILYLVYGIGSRDLAERLQRRDKWRKRWDKMKGPFVRRKASMVNEQQNLIDIKDVAADFAGAMR
ncbi:MAG: iron ABC transporter permease [Clostridiales bacterium]|nr:iron ABC transporter permease [Clostridiales bacterium]